MRILLTNDDGIHAPGLLILGRALHAAGHDVVVVAPIDEASGSSAGTGAWHGATSRSVPYTSVDLDLPKAVACYGLAALPALCVAVTFAGAFGQRPDCVVSGVNRGRNVGNSILHSGTVGAVLTAANLACPGLALSIEAHREEPHYQSAIDIGLPLIDLACALPHGMVVNLNVPDLAASEIRGVKMARLGTNPVIFAAERHADEIALSRGLRHAQHFNLGSDEQLTTSGFASVTIVEPAKEARGESIDALVEKALESLDDGFGDDGGVSSSYA